MLTTLLATTVAAIGAPPAGDPCWDEIGDGGSDAGSVGAGAQTTLQGTQTIFLECITGQLADTLIGGDLEDMFLIRICDPASFEAHTSDQSFSNTILWLFEIDETGAVANDNISPVDFQSRITATATDETGYTVVPGLYYLAITGFPNGPNSASGPIFAFDDAPVGTEISGPDGPGGGDPLSTWVGTKTTSGFYTITLGGVTWADAAGDCNGNGIVDACDIISGTSLDMDMDGVPDECACADTTSYTAGNAPRCVVAGRLNMDMDLDVAVVNRIADDVSVFRNIGDGKFAPQMRYDVGNNPRGMAIGDIDGDTDPDLAVANLEDNTVSLLVNDGAGVFTVGPALPVAMGPFWPALAHIDGDVHLDLVVAHAPLHMVAIYTNDGSGVFTPATTHAVGSFPRHVVAADLDGNGSNDLVTANRGTDDISVLLAPGGGGFAAEVRYDAVDVTESVAVGDLDCDGDVDVVAGNRWSRATADRAASRSS
jgi:hypothetical protein